MRDQNNSDLGYSELQEDAELEPMEILSYDPLALFKALGIEIEDNEDNVRCYFCNELICKAGVTLYHKHTDQYIIAHEDCAEFYCGIFRCKVCGSVLAISLINENQFWDRGSMETTINRI